MMVRSWDTVAIVGVGLIGGSLGLALKERGLARTRVGVGRRATSLESARQNGSVDETSTDLATVAERAELIVCCATPTAVIEHLDTIRAHGRKDVVVTDVASTKAEICAHAEQTWPAPRRFTGSHPMTGSEKSGPAHARGDLFEDAVVFVETSDSLAVDAAADIRALWTDLGARVIDIRPDTHDRWVALTSHVPHVAAAALAALVTDPDVARSFIGPGYLSTTRIADGRPDLWRDICLTNAEPVAVGLEALIERLDDFRVAVREGNGEAIEAMLRSARESRRKFVP